MAIPRGSLLDELRGALHGGSLVTDADVLAAAATDQTGGMAAEPALALLRARSVDDVVAALRWATRHHVPVVPRGAGTGLAGGANAVDGGLTIDVSAMDRILELDAADRVAVVQPGVLNADLTRAAAEHGLTYPPDPASWEISTIGGNVATNAGGLCCVKYGVTADYVLGLELVLPDGRVLRTGRRTVKGVVGYDLSRLVVGSEGTLGVITEVTLRLVPAPEAPATFVAIMPTLAATGEAIATVTREGLDLSLLEILDNSTIRAIEAHRPRGLDPDAAAVLLGQSDGPRRAEVVARLERVCAAAGATYAAATTDPDEAAALLEARRAAYPALEASGAALLDDVAVPVSRLVELIAEIERIAARHEVLIGTFGHAGDGNLHPTIVHDPADPDARARADAAFAELLDAARRLGGTVTGEHGVGRLKVAAAAEELGPVSVELHRAVKAAFDPLGIMNPGAVLA